jgi:multidrug efflux pump subunit AcrA (membrane-fusion protein)
VSKDPVWVEILLRSEDARAVSEKLHGLLVRPAAAPKDLRFESDRVNLVSLAPAGDRATGSVAAVVEVRGSNASGLRPGVTGSAEILLAGTIRGTVVPETALVDGAGVPAVYRQVGGESFARHEVRVVAHHGNEVMVEGLQPGERLVVRGASALGRLARSNR